MHDGSRAGVIWDARCTTAAALFQIESRAQMSALPRTKPKTFRDLSMQVAIIRPGPVTGKFVNPYIERRLGRQPVTYLHPSFKPFLERTLGVPLFQEQVMKIGMVAANLTGGEAEELRKAMGGKRSESIIAGLNKRLHEGMTANGFDEATQAEVIRVLSTVREFMFPESHAHSFASIAYSSAYTRYHYSAAYTCALLNCQPMGFYSPATIANDAKRHRVKMLPIDVQHSDWFCTLEKPSEDDRARYAGPFAVRMGLAIPRGRKPARCPVTMLEAWLDFARIKEGPIFRPIRQNGKVLDNRLTDRSVALIVKRHVGHAGFTAEEFSGHSLRSGLATSAAAAGQNERDIMIQTRHKSVEMVRRYIQKGTLFQGNVVSALDF